MNTATPWKKLLALTIITTLLCHDIGAAQWATLRPAKPPAETLAARFLPGVLPRASLPTPARPDDGVSGRRLTAFRQEESPARPSAPSAWARLNALGRLAAGWARRLMPNVPRAPETGAPSQPLAAAQPAPGPESPAAAAQTAALPAGALPTATPLEAPAPLPAPRANEAPVPLPAPWANGVPVPTPAPWAKEPAPASPSPEGRAAADRMLVRRDPGIVAILPPRRERQPEPEDNRPSPRQMFPFDPTLTWTPRTGVARGRPLMKRDAPFRSLRETNGIQRPGRVPWTGMSEQVSSTNPELKISLGEVEYVLWLNPRATVGSARRRMGSDVGAGHVQLSDGTRYIFDGPIGFKPRPYRGRAEEISTDELAEAYLSGGARVLPVPVTRPRGNVPCAHVVSTPDGRTRVHFCPFHAARKKNEMGETEAGLVHFIARIHPNATREVYRHPTNPRRTVHQVTLAGGEAYHYTTGSPLVLDLDGDGFRTLASRVSFDLDADGSNERLPALPSGDALLVFDADRDGKAGENGLETLGNFTDLDADGRPDGHTDGFAALKALVEKAAREGVLPASAAGDGLLNARELSALEAAYGLALRRGGFGGKNVSLARAGVAALWLATGEVRTRSNFDGRGTDLMSAAGARFLRADGTRGDYADLWFAMPGQAARPALPAARPLPAAPLPRTSPTR